MPDSRPRTRRSRWLISFSVALVVVAGVLVGLGTNAFGPGRVCHDWLSAADIQKAVPGTGRLSSADDSPSSCTVEHQGLFGGNDVQLTVMAVGEPTRFPFEPATWSASGRDGLLTGKTAGVVNEQGGWVLLPESCRTVAEGQAGTGRPVLRAMVSGGKADRKGMARLLESAAASLAKKSGCAPADAATVGAPSEPSVVSPTRFGQVCAVPGFALSPVTGPRGQSVREQVSGSLDVGSAWICDLSFSDDEKNGPFTRLSVVRDEAWAQPLDATRVTRAQCGGQETYFVVDNVAYPWEPQERAATGFPSEADLDRRFVAAVRQALGCA